ncbi:MAG: hypothetical protein ACE5IK_07945 [Acidobacteriota bacterium]
MTPSPVAGGGRHLALPSLVASVAALAGAVTGGALYFRDIGLLHRPTRLLVRHLWASGALPIWDAARDGGRVLLANPNHLVLHPTALLDLMFSVDVAYTISVVLQIFLAGWGLERLLTDRGVAPFAARVGGLAFGLSGPLLSLGNLPNLLGGVAWVPLGLWAASRVRHDPARWLPLAAGICAVPYFAGGVESVTCLAAILLVDAALAPPRRRRLALAVGTLGLGTALAAIQILPAMATLRGSERSMGLRPVQILYWSTAPWRLLETILPGLWGEPVDPAAWYGTPRFDGGVPLILSMYLGPAVLVLAITGVAEALRRRRPGGREGPVPPPAVRLLVASGVAGAGTLFLTLGRYNPLLAAGGEIPVAGSFLRYPQRLVPLLVLPVAVAAAIGLESVWRRRASGVRSSPVFRAGLTAGLIGLTAHVALAAAGHPVVSWLLDAPSTATLARASHGLMRSGATALASLLAFAACVALAGSARRRGLAAGFVAVVIAADLIAAGGGLNPTVSPVWLRSRPASAAFLLDSECAGGPPVRLVRDPDPAVRGNGLVPAAAVVWERESLAGLVANELGISTALDEAVDRSSPLGSAILARAHAAAAGAVRERLADRAGATWQLRFVAASRSIEPPAPYSATVLPGAPRVVLRPRPGAADRVSLVPRGVDAGDLNRPGALRALLDHLGDPGSDPRSEVFLSGSHGESIDGRWAPGEGRIERVEERPAGMTVETWAPGEGVLVVRDAILPGWRARLDGQSVPIIRTDLAWRGVQVPPGSHRVVFAYHQPGLVAGAWISGAGVAACGLLVALAWRRRRGPAAVSAQETPRPLVA